MSTILIYEDLKLDIAVLSQQISDYEEEKKQWWMGGRLYNTVSMHIAAEKVDRINNKIDILTQELEIKKKRKERLEHQLSRYQGIEYQIFYKKYVEGKKLDLIAEELGKSHEYIRSIHAKIKFGGE